VQAGEESPSSPSGPGRSTVRPNFWGGGNIFGAANLPCRVFVTGFNLLLRMQNVSPPPLAPVLSIYLVACAIFLARPAQGQADVGSTLDAKPVLTAPPDARRSTKGSPSPTLSLPPQSDDARFAKAVLGSTLGALIGGGLGGLIIAAANSDDRAPFRDDEHSPEGVALLLIAGGPPVGAVLKADLPQDRAGAYVMSAMGEFVLGGGGAALGAALGGDSEEGQLAGALGLGIPGIVLGAAGGAVLGASDRSTRGAAHYDDGEWTLGAPSVRPGLHLQPEPGFHGTVSLVTVGL